MQASFNFLQGFFRGGVFVTVFGSSALMAQTQTVLYTGSDTVHPVAEAALSAFMRGHPSYKPQLKDTGTGAGLKEFCAGRALIAGASRSMKADESKACATAGIQVVEIPAALDAVVLVVSTKNTWLKDMTLAEVSKAFDSASAGKITSWKQIRATFPDSPMKVAGVDIKHATFGFFSEQLGLNGFMRSDYKDFKTHALTGGYVGGDPTVLGFMPLGEAVVLSGQVRPIGIDFGAGVVNPGNDEIAAGKYDKLTRTVYLYVNPAALAKASPDDFAYTTSLVKDMDKYVRFANLVPLRSLQYQENAKRLTAAK
jgi:phosphate transport system substrate-binding protein